MFLDIPSIFIAFALGSFIENLLVAYRAYCIANVWFNDLLWIYGLMKGDVNQSGALIQNPLTDNRNDPKLPYSKCK